MDNSEIPYVSTYSNIKTFFDWKKFSFPNFLKKGVICVKRGYEVHGSLPEGDRFVLFCHGWRCTDERFEEALDFVKRSLDKEGVKTGFIGWRWRSDVSWSTANKVAGFSGRGMADFIEGVRQENPEVEFVIIGYSLGVKVVLECLKSLDSPQKYLGKVFLVAGAIGCSSLTRGSDYWSLIQESCVKFYSYYNPSDDTLKFLFPFQGALGREGVSEPEPDGFQEYEMEFGSSNLITRNVHRSYFNGDSGVFDTIASKITDSPT